MLDEATADDDWVSQVCRHNVTGVSEIHAPWQCALQHQSRVSTNYRDTTASFVVEALNFNVMLLFVQLLAFSCCLCSSELRQVLAPLMRKDEVPPCFLVGWALRALREARWPVAPRDREPTPLPRQATAAVEPTRHEPTRPRQTSSESPRTRILSIDGAVMVRFCILGFKYSLVGSIMALVLIPWYERAERDREGESSFFLGDFSRFNLSHLSSHKDRFWLVVVVAYLLTATFLHLALEEWSMFLEMRRYHFSHRAGAHGHPSQNNQVYASTVQAERSLLVEMVPKKRRALDGSAVKAFFEEIFPFPGVHSCVVQAETGLLYARPEVLVAAAGRKTLQGFRSALEKQLANTEQAFHINLNLNQARLPLKFPLPLLDFGADREAQSANESQDAYIEVPTGEEEQDDVDQKKKARRRCRRWTIVDEACDALQDLRVLLLHGFRMCGSMARRTWEAVRMVCTVVLGSAEVGPNTGSSTAFVTFRSVADRVVAEQLVLSSSAGEHWVTRAAPEARDIVWGNAAVPLLQVRVRGWLAGVMVFLGLIFWAIPCTLVQAWTEAAAPCIRGALEKVNKSWGAQLYHLLNAYLPTLALMGLLYVLPVALELLSRTFEGYKAKSEIQRVVMRRYFLFQLATLYFTVLSGSLIGNLCRLLVSPTSIFEILKTSIPSVAVYFVTYVMARIGLSLPLLLLFPALSLCDCSFGCCRGCCKRRKYFCRCKRSTEPEADPNAGESLPADSSGSSDSSEESESLPERPPPVRPDYAFEASSLGMVLLLALMYSCVAPAIMPVCMLFFALASLIYRWLFLYVYEPEYDCNGTIWYELFRGSLMGLLLGNLALASMAPRYVSIEFFLLLLLACLVVFMQWLFFVYFAVPSNYLSLEDARQIDKACDAAILSVMKDDYYIDPVIKNNRSRFDTESEEEDEAEAESSESHVVHGSRWCSCCCRYKASSRAPTTDSAEPPEARQIVAEDPEALE